MERDRIEYEGVVLHGAKFTCTRCGETKSANDFGLRRMGDKTIRNQAQCKQCRCIKANKTAQ